MNVSNNSKLDLTLEKAEKEKFFLEFFDTVPRAQLKAFMSFCKQETLPLHAVLYRKGDKPDQLYFIISGRIEISDKVTGGVHSQEESTYNEGQSPTNIQRKRLQKKLVYEAFRGSLVGEMEIVYSEEQRRFTAIAVEETRVIIMSESSYKSCIDGLAPAIVDEISSKTNVKKDWINTLLQKKATHSIEKLARLNRNRSTNQFSTNSIEVEREKHIAQLQESFQILQRKFISKSFLPPQITTTTTAAATATHTTKANAADNVNSNTNLSVSPIEKSLKFFGATNIPREFLNVDIFADNGSRSPFECLSPLLQSKMPFRRQKSMSPLKSRKPSLEFDPSSPTTPKESPINHNRLFQSPVLVSSLPQIPTFEKKKPILRLKRLQTSTSFSQEPQQKMQQSTSNSTITTAVAQKKYNNIASSLSRINTSLDDLNSSSDRIESSKRTQAAKQADLLASGIEDEVIQPLKYSLASSYTVSPNKFNLKKVFKSSQQSQSQVSLLLSSIKKGDLLNSSTTEKVQQFFLKPKEHMPIVPSTTIPTSQLPQLSVIQNSKHQLQMNDAVINSNQTKVIDKNLFISGITNNTTCPTDDTQTRSPVRKRSQVWQRGILKRFDESPIGTSGSFAASSQSVQQLHLIASNSNNNNHIHSNKSYVGDKLSQTQSQVNHNPRNQTDKQQHTHHMSTQALLNEKSNFHFNNIASSNEHELLLKTQKKSILESLGISSLAQQIQQIQQDFTHNQHQKSNSNSNNNHNNQSLCESHGMIIRNLSPCKQVLGSHSNIASGLVVPVSSPSHRKILNQSDHVSAKATAAAVVPAASSVGIVGVGNYFDRFKCRQSLNNLNEILQRSNQCRFKAMNIDSYMQKAAAINQNSSPSLLIPSHQQTIVPTFPVKARLAAEKQEKLRIHSQIGLYITSQSNTVVGTSASPQLPNGIMFPSKEILQSSMLQKSLKHSSLHSHTSQIVQ